MAAIQDLVLTFCPKMHCTPQRKLKLLMPLESHLSQMSIRLSEEGTSIIYFTIRLKNSRTKYSE